jgi:hypothetical protein
MKPTLVSLNHVRNYLLDFTLCMYISMSMIDYSRSSNNVVSAMNYTVPSSTLLYHEAA